MFTILRRGIRLLLSVTVWLLPLVIGGGAACLWIINTSSQNEHVAGILFGGLVAFLGYSLLLTLRPHWVRSHVCPERTH